MKNNKITFEEHKQMGKMLKKFYKKLIDEHIIIFNSSPSKKLARNKTIHYDKSIKAIIEIRNHLEAIMSVDYPEKANTNIYYGETEEEKK